MVSGEIVAGPHVRNACKRHIADLKRKDGIWFDHNAAGHAFAFFEEVLKLSEGQFEGQPFELQPSQAFIVGSLFGWKRKDGRRRFRRAYIEQGKGVVGRIVVEPDAVLALQIRDMPFAGIANVRPSDNLA